MSEVSKVPTTALLIKDQRACWRCQRCELLYCNTNKGSKGYVCRRCRKWCLWLLHNTAYRVLLLMSEVSKVIVLCIQWPLAPARREGYLSLPSWGFSCSPLVGGGSFVNFLGLVNYKGDCRQEAQAIPNSYIN